MKSHSRLLPFLSLLALAGCAAYQLEPLRTNHPAHSEAVAVSERSFSKTLAYTPSDIPSPRPVLAAAMGEQSRQGARPSDAGAQQTVVGEGKVIATVPNAGQIVVEHGEIKG